MMHKSWIIVAGIVTFLAATQPVSAEVWFTPEAIFWNRTSGSDTNYLTGPNSLSSDSADSGFQPGYRYIIGAGFMEYEVEAQFTRIDNWGGTSTGSLTAPVSFDNNFSNPLLFPAGSNRISNRSGVFDAATRDLVNPEGEFLRSGALYRIQNESTLRDFQINVGPNRRLNWYRWTVGYRQLTLTENSGFRLSGQFDSLDTDDAAGPGLPGNLGNDGLSHANLVAAGFTNIAGGADGYNSINTLAIPPTVDIVDVLSNGSARNRLEGFQASLIGQHQIAPNLFLEGFGRFGLYRNDVQGSVTEALIGSGISDNSVYIRRLSDSRDKAAFVTNLGFNLYLDLTDYISLTTGYEALFIHGVAVGGDQTRGVSRDPFGTLNYQVEANNLVIAHGTKVGLEVRW
ncbi:MAG: hypothetical protein R3C01_04460 [Planctomycetaceae bacterium]